MIKTPSARSKQISQAKIRISIGEDSLFRDNQHLVKMSTAQDNPTHWHVYKIDLPCHAPMSATEMKNVVIDYCGDSVIVDGDVKSHTILELDLSHKNSVNLAGARSTKKNLYHPANAMKKSSIYSPQDEYAFVVVSLTAASVSSHKLGGFETTPEGQLAQAIRQMKADCLQRLKCHKTLPTQFKKIRLDSKGSAHERAVVIDRIIDSAAKDLLLCPANRENPSFIKYTRLIFEVGYEISPVICHMSPVFVKAIDAADLGNLPTGARMRTRHERPFEDERDEDDDDADDDDNDVEGNFNQGMGKRARVVRSEDAEDLIVQCRKCQYPLEQADANYCVACGVKQQMTPPPPKRTLKCVDCNRTMTATISVRFCFGCGSHNLLSCVLGDSSLSATMPLSMGDVVEES